MFYSIKHNDHNLITKKEGLFLSDDSKYHEGGMYFGLSNSVFMKLGYQNFSGKLEEFDKNGDKSNNSKYGDPFTQSGIVAGLALVLPVVHLEVGYNYVFDSFYAGAGINIPIKGQ